ncbi:unnamed protein product [Cuscuta europaea]|uniref:Uncharacterized protein n=1 Tax=Cuscuta europaea TaxID=41803 RepID=A0A9P0YGM5_CUSEU|nr:unnamed protein product [Cuscuta europaea]
MLLLSAFVQYGCKGLWAAWVNSLSGNASSIMQNLLDSILDIFDSNCCTQVNNGRNSWCDLGPLYHFQNDIPSVILHATVSEAITNGKLIHFCLPRYIMI